MLATRRYAHDPDPAWQAQLDALAPPSPVKSRLVIRWHSGREYYDDALERLVWQPIERWLVWEVLPTATMSPRFPAVRRMAGPRREGGVDWNHPGLFGVPGLMDLDRTCCDRGQWQLYLETGQYARIVWVIQGSQGGHQRRFDEWQQLLMSRRQLPKDPPYPGELPYAPVDERVWRQLRILRMQAPLWTTISDQAEKAWHTLDQEEQDGALAARQALADWSEQQMYDVLDQTTRQERSDLRALAPAGLGRSDTPVATGADALERYIHEGVRV